MSVAALFCRSDSVYRVTPGVVSVWDEAADARNYCGPFPVVAHPPCRAWGKFVWKAKPRPGERDLAFRAVDFVRRYGGVLEHPVGSRLWREAPLVLEGEFDAYGGTTIRINQCDFGHRALKPTRLYVCGVDPADFPPMPPPSPPVTTVELLGRAERERTPPDLALWLVQLASKAKPKRP